MRRYERIAEAYGAAFEIFFIYCFAKRSAANFNIFIIWLFRGKISEIRQLFRRIFACGGGNGGI